MKRLYVPLLILLVIHTVQTRAQIMPAENNRLNYRLIGFSVPMEKDAASYCFEIAKGSFYNADSFQHNIIKTFTHTNNRTIETVPSFGKYYTWRYITRSKKGSLSISGLYHFYTLEEKYIDTSVYKITVLKDEADTDLLILIDNSAVIYDHSGAPLWFIPDQPEIIDRTMNNRDLKPTADGTFTLLNTAGAFEFSYNGALIWKAPNDGKISGDSTEHYHHEFTRLDNGHYMVAGSVFFEKRVPSYIDTNLLTHDATFKRKGVNWYRNIEYGTLIEYDSKGKIVWSCKTDRYFGDSDIYKQQDGQIISDLHMNSFYLNKERSAIYIGFRGTSSILKIAYPSGKLIARYNGESEFNGQHACYLDNYDRLVMYNNNGQRGARRQKAVSQINIFEETSDHLKKIWDFACDIDTNTIPFTSNGGSAYELTDGNILACMGSASRIFIVTPDKKVMWNAITYYRDGTGNWLHLPLYKAYAIHKSELEKFIFKN